VVEGYTGGNLPIERGAPKLVSPSAGTRRKQSIVLRCRVTAFYELCQMFLVDAIDLGLHLGMPALDQDGECTHQSSRAKPIEYEFVYWTLSQGIRRLGHAAA
jgi:hypothetical protein